MKRKTKRILATILIVVVLAFVWDRGVWQKRYLLPEVFGEAVYQIETPRKVVALTFDDGPTPAYTPAISKILADHQAKGTFFVVGKHAQEHPEILQALMADGHEIGNHTWHHYNLDFHPSASIEQEILSTDEVVRQAGYRDPIPFRPPYGHSLLSLPQVLKQMDRANIMWNIDLLDWRQKSPEEMMQILEASLENGSIILLHDGDGTAENDALVDRANTVAVVEKILDTYIPQGYQFVTVSELLSQGKAIVYRD